MQEKRLNDLLQQLVIDGPRSPLTEDCIGIGTLLKLLDCPQEVPDSKRQHLLDCAYCQRMLYIARRDRRLIDAPLFERIDGGDSQTGKADLESGDTESVQLPHDTLLCRSTEVEEVGIAKEASDRDKTIRVVNFRTKRWWGRLSFAAAVILAAGTLVWAEARLNQAVKGKIHTMNGFEEARTYLSEVRIGIEQSLKLADEGTPSEVRALLQRLLANVEHERSRLSHMHQPVFSGDKSRFVRDVSIPDYTQVQPSAAFHKIWEIENVGTVHWKNRFLQREKPIDGPNRLGSPVRVRVPDTAPGERCQIGIDLVAPIESGICYAEFKMVDANGEYLLPTQQPVFVLVEIINK